MQSIEIVSVAQQKNKLAYQEIFGERYSDITTVSAFRIVISNMDGSERELVNTNTNNFSPCWSPANDKIAFHTQEKNEEFKSKYYYQPSQIALYDYETKTISQLTHGDECNLTPVFSKNGAFLLFQSTKNAPDIDLTRMELIPTNIWLINLKTLESFQVTDISKTSLVAVQQPYLIDNDRFLFTGIYPDGKRQLFESSVSEKQINPLLDSQWNDYAPSISPDQTKIAFISDRSGMEQVWIYHIDSKKYTQITGYSTDESVRANIEWLDNSTIVFTIRGNKLVKQKVE